MQPRNLTREHVEKLASDPSNVVYDVEYQEHVAWSEEACRRVLSRLYDHTKAQAEKNVPKYQIMKSARELGDEEARFCSDHPALSSRMADIDFISNPSYMVLVEIMLKKMAQVRSGERSMRDAGEEFSQQALACVMRETNHPSVKK